MNIDGNLVRIPVDAFDEFNKYNNQISFYHDGGEDFIQLFFYKD